MLDAFPLSCRSTSACCAEGSLDIATSEAEVELLRRLVRMQREELGDEEIRYLDRRVPARAIPGAERLLPGGPLSTIRRMPVPLKLAHALAREAVRMGCEIGPGRGWRRSSCRAKRWRGCGPEACWKPRWW
jgi:hypothetical protein